jgi:hypothetical protein
VIGSLTGFGKRIRRWRHRHVMATTSIYILYRQRAGRRNAFAFRTHVRACAAMKSSLDNIYFVLTIR